ncbi:hypothetical protein P7F88_20425 [Vibrio hannami]|uniref:hypothetical protein n=1 Tax=Vibrio hannami TaxID=2717094 RepID=UPI00241093BB|nr:hypothetical protein [Vibrio hannami]MDG3088308.1 hypothetical protein [Vibrio hannami]
MNNDVYHKFIESVVRMTGTFRASLLIEEFGVTDTTATRVIKSYSKRAPGNLRFVRTNRSYYEKSKGFKPAFPGTDPETYLLAVKTVFTG